MKGRRKRMWSIYKMRVREHVESGSWVEERRLIVEGVKRRERR